MAATAARIQTLTATLIASEQASGEARGVRQVAFSGEGEGVELSAAPGYGEHTEEVLRELGGLDDTEVASLLRSGAAAQKAL